MSLSDCSQCWSTPCTCGHEYRYWPEEDLYAQIKMLVGVLTVKQSSPLQPVIDKIADTCRRGGIH